MPKPTPRSSIQSCNASFASEPPTPSASSGTTCAVASSVDAKFRRQHVLGDYVVDFVCLERRLVIELDGGQHADEMAIAKDARRTAFWRKAG